MADEKQTKCLRCGSTNRVHGSLSSFSGVVFLKDDGDIFGRNPQLHAWVCLDCGHAELVVAKSKGDKS